MFSNKNKIFLGLVVALIVIGVFFPVFDSLAELDQPINLEVGIGGETTTRSITGYIKQIYIFATGIVAGLAAIMIVIGGIRYSMAAGNPKVIASAKETIISAIIGLVIVALAYLILGLFGTQFTDLREPDLEDVNVDETNLPQERWTDCSYIDDDPVTGGCPDGYQVVDGSNCSGSAGQGQNCCCQENEPPPEQEYSYRRCNGANMCEEATTHQPNPTNECDTPGQPCTEEPHGGCYSTQREASENCTNGVVQSGELWCCKSAPAGSCEEYDDWCDPGDCCEGLWCNENLTPDKCDQSWRS